MEKLILLVQDWAKEKGILDKGTLTSQLNKTREECEELMGNLIRPVKIFENIEDDLGDILVTLIIYCKMKDLDFHFIYSASIEGINTKLSFTPKELKRKVQKQIDNLEKYNKENQIENVILEIDNLISTLYFVAKYINKPLIKCLETAYNVISKRTGKMVNGVFVKDN